MPISIYTGAARAPAQALLACGLLAWTLNATGASNLYTIECTGGPDPAVLYQYHIDNYKKAVRMTRQTGSEVVKDPNFLLDGKKDTSVKFIDDKVIMSYANEEQNTYTIVLPVFGGTGNMKIGNIDNEKEHPDGYRLSCARK